MGPGGSGGSLEADAQSDTNEQLNPGCAGAAEATAEMASRPWRKGGRGGWAVSPFSPERQRNTTYCQRRWGRPGRDPLLKAPSALCLPPPTAAHPLQPRRPPESLAAPPATGLSPQSSSSIWGAGSTELGAGQEGCGQVGSGGEGSDAAGWRLEDGRMRTGQCEADWRVPFVPSLGISHVQGFQEQWGSWV